MLTIGRQVLPLSVDRKTLLSTAVLSPEEVVETEQADVARARTRSNKLILIFETDIYL
jgi:hypothetical protein